MDEKLQVDIKDIKTTTPSNQT